MSKRGVLFSGQSNGIGLCVASAVTNFPGFATSYPAVQFWDKNSLNRDPPSFLDDGPRDLGPRTKAISNPSLAIGTCGTEISMLQTLNAAIPGVWAGAKVAIDGSSLEDQWVNPAYPTGGPAFLTTYLDLIQTMMTGLGAVLDTVVWDQGGTDAGAIPDGADYLVNLTTLMIGGVRARFGPVAIIIDRLSSQYVASQGELVRAGQDSFCAGNSRTALIQTTDLDLRDVIHFSDNSYATLGVRQAQARLAMEGVATIQLTGDVVSGTAQLGAPVFGAATIQLAGDTVHGSAAIDHGRFVSIPGLTHDWEVFDKRLPS